MIIIFLCLVLMPELWMVLSYLYQDHSLLLLSFKTRHLLSSEPVMHDILCCDL